MGFNEMEKEGTEEVSRIYGQHHPAGKPPVEDCRNKRPDANRKVGISHFELELLMLLPPPHPDLVGLVINRVPDKTDDPDNADKDCCCYPDRDVNADKKKEYA